MAVMAWLDFRAFWVGFQRGDAVDYGKEKRHCWREWVAECYHEIID